MDWPRSLSSAAAAVTNITPRFVGWLAGTFAACICPVFGDLSG
jgi:hypothetical protein